jgi:stage II sporulation protein Q
MKDDESFNVVASLSGTVTRVDEDAVLGNVIEVEHDKGIVTQYQSVKDIKVKVGQEVKQGQVLATAGQSLFNEKAGTHVHFEIRKDGIAVNPSDYFNKSLSTLQEAVLSNDKASESVETPQMKENQQMIDEPGNSSDQETNVDKESTPTENTNS